MNSRRQRLAIVKKGISPQGLDFLVSSLTRSQLFFFTFLLFLSVLLSSY